MSAHGNGMVPSPAHASALAAELLGSVGTRLAHVLRAGSIASQLAALFDDREAALLVAAATLHDIGYAPGIAHTGFHPLDGGMFLAGRGFSLRLAGLVANHSLAYLNAPAHGIHNLEELFPRETGLLADALMFADMHSAPNGSWVRGADRLAEIAGRHTYPGTSRRLELVGQALARVANAAQTAGLPNLDLGPALEPLPSADGTLLAATAVRDDNRVPGSHGGHLPRGREPEGRTVSRMSGPAARLRIAASRHASGGPGARPLGRPIPDPSDRLVGR
jgi:hypothetical protein